MRATPASKARFLSGTSAASAARFLALRGRKPAAVLSPQRIVYRGNEPSTLEDLNDLCWVRPSPVRFGRVFYHRGLGGWRVSIRNSTGWEYVSLPWRLRKADKPEVTRWLCDVVVRILSLPPSISWEQAADLLTPRRSDDWLPVSCLEIAIRRELRSRVQAIAAGRQAPVPSPPVELPMKSLPRDLVKILDEDDIPQRLAAHVERMRQQYPTLKFTKKQAARSLLMKALRTEEQQQKGKL